MKRVLFLVTLFFAAFFFSSSSQAQVYLSTLHPDTYIGIKAGANFQDVNGSAFVPTFNTGYIAGLYAGKHWKKVGVHIEVLASSAHYTTQNSVSYDRAIVNHDTGKGDFNVMYLNVPLLLEIKLKKKLHLELGPQYTYMLSIKDNNGNYTKEFNNDKFFKTGEVCFDLGINGDLPYHLNLGARYVRGLTSINNGTFYRAYDAWQINALQVLLSYKF